MSNTIQSRRKTKWPALLEWGQKSGAVLTVIAIAVFGFWGGHFLLPGQDHPEVEPASSEPPTTTASPVVQLTQEKLAAAELDSAPVELMQFQSHQTVSGTIVYDTTRKVELRSSVESVVKQLMVRPLDRVQKGETLLLLSSPEIGSARGEISRCQASVELLQKEFDWTNDTHSNMQELLALLKQSPTPEQVKTLFGQKSLGEHRHEILSAYSELTLARLLTERTGSLETQGAISGREADRRRSKLEVASAKFDAIREEMEFQSQQGVTRAKANLESEKRRLEICREKLAALLGPFTQEETANSDSSFALFAPRAGQVVELQAVESARFEPGEVMAVIADTETVWVEAQISQRDWYSLKLENEQMIDVRVPALPERSFQAKVRHIGASVSKNTLAIPLVAEINNPNHLFRPGMSVWVDVPTGESRSSLVVPIAAVQRIEMQTFVFVQTGNATFAPRQVEIGQQSTEHFEIKSGLSAGDQVVGQGAFFLKSELLLAEEGD